MEKLLESASIAWNPIGEVRRRMTFGTLSVSTMLVPLIGIVISSNLFVSTAQNFYFQAVIYQGGGQMPDHPLLTEFATRMMSSIGVLMPVGAVAVLPAAIFHPPGRNATLATLLIVAAAGAFYRAAIFVPVLFVSGVLATVDWKMGVRVFTLLSTLGNIVLFGLTTFFWFRATLSALRLSGGRVIGITVVVAVIQALTTWSLYLVLRTEFLTPL